jgi:hypothetical protein
VVSRPPSETDACEALIESLRLALTGVGPEATAAHASLTNVAATNPAAAAFSPGSTRATVDLGAGLWAVLRTSADRARQVLCVHNTSERPQGFLPLPHLDAAANTAAALVFLGGETRTEEVPGGLRCELKPLGFVWLGNFTSHSGENTR